MVPPPSWTALESSGLGRSASLSAGPRIQQVNDAAWPLPGWACANVSVAINRVIRMSSLPRGFLYNQDTLGNPMCPAQQPGNSHSRRVGPVKHWASSAVQCRAHASRVGTGTSEPLPPPGPSLFTLDSLLPLSKSEPSEALRLKRSVV